MHMSRQPAGTSNIRSLKARVESPAGRFRSALLLFCLACSLRAATGSPDAAFARIPFEQWQAAGKLSQLHWSLYTPEPTLSAHQRLLLRTVVRIDGHELEKRRASSSFLALIEYRDASGTVWRNHTDIDPSKLAAGMDHQYLDISFYAFILPGDYTVSMAICDPATLQHSLALRKLHVDALRADPLPALWQNLPPVEIIPPLTEPPDIWYLPEVTTRPNVTLATRRPVHIHVLLNTTPSQRSAGSVSTLRANMSLLIPALKVISGVDVSNGAIDTELLDLTHRKIVFEQKQIHNLNWDIIRKFFDGNHPGLIDAAALQGQWKMRRFFWDEVTRNLKPEKDGATPVVIVLSGPAFLEDQEPPESSISSGESPARLFYIRYRTQTPPRPMNNRGSPLRDTMMGRSGRGRMMVPPANPDYIPPMPLDDLEQAVAPLNARLFDAASSQQFRRVLAAVLEQISRM